MVGTAPSITPTPAADTVEPGPDPVFRFHLQGTPGQKVTVSYVTAVPPGPRTAGRLQAWAEVRNDAAAQYWQEKHQLASLAVTPPASQIQLPGPPQQLVLSGKQSDGTDAPTVALDSVVWKSSNPAVASVDEHGLVTGAGIGSADIVATVGKTTATATATVVASARPASATSCSPETPAPPTADVAGTTVTVSWRPLVPDHCTLTGYQVTASPSGQMQSVGAGSTSIDFSSLSSGTYSFTLIAEFGDDGSSPASPSSTSVDVSCGSVDPPSQLYAQEDTSGGGSVNVGWTIPTVPDGCDGPSSYEIDLDGRAGTTASSGSTSTSLTVPPGTHRINVLAVMPNGERIPGSGTSVNVAPEATSDTSVDSSSSGG